MSTPEVNLTTNKRNGCQRGSHGLESRALQLIFHGLRSQMDFVAVSARMEPACEPSIKEMEEDEDVDVDVGVDVDSTPASQESSGEEPRQQQQHVTRNGGMAEEQAETLSTSSASVRASDDDDEDSESEPEPGQYIPPPPPVPAGEKDSGSDFVPSEEGEGDHDAPASSGSGQESFSVQSFSSEESEGVGGGGGQRSRRRQGRGADMPRKRGSGQAQFWTEDPEMYGLRRSCRVRGESSRAKIDYGISSSEGEEGQSSGPNRTASDDEWMSVAGKKRKNLRRLDSSEEDKEEGEEEEEEEDLGSDEEFVLGAKQKTKKARQAQKWRGHKTRGRTRKPALSSDDELMTKYGQPQRMTGRQKEAINYKEESEDDDLLGSEVNDLADDEGLYIPEDDNRPVIEKVLEARQAQAAVLGEQSSLAFLTLHPGKEGEEPMDQESVAMVTDLQYLIKWMGKAHLHNTWETADTLEQMGLKSLKKLENFVKREELKAAWKEMVSPEDVEFAACQDQLNQELLKNHLLLERVIASRSVEGEEEGAPPQQQYLCKWCGLPYAESTWEAEALVGALFQTDADAFLRRSNSDRIPARSSKVLKTRPRFKVMNSQLPQLGRGRGLQLRDYQLDGLNWMAYAWCKHNSVILADEMGLGKTIQVLSFLSYLYHVHGLFGPFLVVVPLSTVMAWCREGLLWAPELNTVVYLGDTASRAVIREHEWCYPNGKLKFNVVLTTYEILLKDKDFLQSVSWAVLAVDEAHRLKNDDSCLYQALNRFTTHHRLLITGTPLQNSLRELWALLYFIMPQEFARWEEFEASHSAYSDGDASCLQDLHQQLQPYLLRRVKRDVERSLPAKVEQILRVDMTSLQRQYYKWILTKNYHALNRGQKGSTGSFINVVMELKKCCNHASLTRPTDELAAAAPVQRLVLGSGKLILLDKLLTRLRSLGRRVLIFSQMVRMLDILAEYLTLRRYPFQRLDGSIRGELRKQAIDHFNEEGSADFCFLLSTRAGGLGVNLATADSVVIFDSDWNPQNDLQAQARAHRIGQKNQVHIYRLLTRGSVEEDIIERAKQKMVLDHLVIQRMDTTGRTVLSKWTKDHHQVSSSVPFGKDELSAILKFGSEDLFKDGDDSRDKELQEMDIDDILRKAETQDFEPQAGGVANDLLSQFKVASFAIDEEELRGPQPLPTTPTTPSLPTRAVSTEVSRHRTDKSWEELIPAPELSRLQAEEDQARQMSLYLPPRHRSIKNYKEDVGQSSLKPQASLRGKKTGKTSQASPSVSVSSHGLTGGEIRRFMKSFRKFVSPLKRMEVVAMDAELQEKSLHQLQDLAKELQQACQQVSKTTEDEVLIGSVAVSASSLLKRSKELSVLAQALPTNPKARKRYRLLVPTKAVGWSVEWSAVEDSKLLQGVYQHGMGNWEAVKADSGLGLATKILPPNRGLKPQSSHLQTRLDYLIKILEGRGAGPGKRQTTLEDCTSANRRIRSGGRAARKGGSGRRAPPPHPPSGSKGGTSEDCTDDDDYTTPAAKRRRGNPPTRGHRHGNSKPPPPSNKPVPAGRRQNSRRAGSTKSVQPKPSRQRPGGQGRVPAASTSSASSSGRTRTAHVTKGNPSATAPEEDGCSDFELDKEVHSKCKQMLRSVRQWVQLLKNPQGSGDKSAMLKQYKECIVAIGNHISSETSARYSSEEERKEWKSNLWVFVSQLTSASPSKLHKLYKKAVKADQKGRDDEESGITAQHFEDISD